MKKLFTIVLLNIFMAGVVSCGEEKTPPVVDTDGLLEVTPPTLEFTAESGTKIVQVEGLNWETAPSDDWIEIGPAEGGFSVTLGKNPDTEERSGTVTVSNDEDSKTVTVTQEAAEEEEEPDPDPSLTLDVEEFPVDWNSYLKVITVTSELEWSVDDDADWITTAIDENTILVSIGFNEGEERDAVITVDNGVQSKEVKVVQEKYRHKIVSLRCGTVTANQETASFALFFDDFTPDETNKNGLTMVLTFTSGPVDTTGDELDIPEGTYTISAVPEVLTVQPFMVAIYENNTVTDMSAMNSVGTVEVEGDRSGYTFTFEMTATFVSSKVMTVDAYYEGPLSIANPL